MNFLQHSFNMAHNNSKPAIGMGWKLIWPTFSLTMKIKVDFQKTIMAHNTTFVVINYHIHYLQRV